MVERLLHSLLPEYDSFSSRLLWVPPSVSNGGSALKTSVLMHFGYALKIPEWFISKMVIVFFLMCNRQTKFWKKVFEKVLEK